MILTCKLCSKYLVQSVQNNVAKFKLGYAGDDGSFENSLYSALEHVASFSMQE